MAIATEDLKSLPVAVYTTDPDGWLTFYNDAAAELWGRRPELGRARWCGSIRLFQPDGSPLSHEDSLMAKALAGKAFDAGTEVFVERPDGTRVAFAPYPNALRDESGHVFGGINLLIDVTNRKQSEIAFARLAAIVDSSDDAIVSKNLDSIVISWNRAATRIFGYEPEEMIGQSIKQLIPAELQQEEDEIIARLKRGERVDHFDTVRVRKDGRRIDVSLTISPIRDGSGSIVGASKIARDITERKRHEDLQRLLFDELNHRVKNTLATIQAIATQSMRSTSSPAEFVESFNGRVQALGRAHDILVQQKMSGATLGDLVREQVLFGAGSDARLTCSGPEVMLDARVAVQLALVLHELATNARKHGALAAPSGALSIVWEVNLAEGRELCLRWQESGVPGVVPPRTRGFGTTLIERSLESNGGEVSLRFGADGICCDIRLPLAEEVRAPWAGMMPADEAAEHVAEDEPTPPARGRRILVVEDEPLVAMDIEEELKAKGFAVVGPALRADIARRLVAEEDVDAALLDANLGGHRVDDIAEALATRGIPFAFVSGYGREALPGGFRDRMLISKPFDPRRLFESLQQLLQGEA